MKLVELEGSNRKRRQDVCFADEVLARLTWKTKDDVGTNGNATRDGTFDGRNSSRMVMTTVDANEGTVVNRLDTILNMEVGATRERLKIIKQFV